MYFMLERVEGGRGGGRKEKKPSELKPLVVCLTYVHQNKYVK